MTIHQRTGRWMVIWSVTTVFRLRCWLLIWSSSRLSAKEECVMLDMKVKGNGMHEGTSSEYTSNWKTHSYDFTNFYNRPTTNVNANYSQTQRNQFAWISGLVLVETVRMIRKFICIFPLNLTHKLCWWCLCVESFFGSSGSPAVFIEEAGGSILTSLIVISIETVWHCGLIVFL